MRPRNVLTQTNNMRKLMGLPLLNEDTGETAEDVKKKVLTEDRSFSLGFANNGGLTLAEDDIDPMEDNVMQEETIEETTEAEETEEEGDGEEVNDVVEEQLEDYGEGPLGIDTGIDVGSPQPGDGEGGLGLSTDAQVFAEGSFAKYNITLQDKMDLLTEQREDKKRYNFDTIEIDNEAKEEDKLLKRFENILKREDFEFQNMVDGYKNSPKETYFYRYDDTDNYEPYVKSVKAPITAILVRGETNGKPDWYYLDHEGERFGDVSIEGEWNRDSIQDFRRDIKKIKDDAPDYFDDEAMWD